MSYSRYLYCARHLEYVWASVHGGAGDRLAPSNECAIACFLQAHGDCPVTVAAEDFDPLDVMTRWDGGDFEALCERYGVRPSDAARARDAAQGPDLRESGDGDPDGA
ncbi:MAG: hypothetical protein B7733_15175 [Myxococcales bacterium FL481]|nr:MAG: hypothetical protein B7733_15175 [Myxococcales bacterium FL481]